MIEILSRVRLIKCEKISIFSYIVLSENRYRYLVDWMNLKTVSENDFYSWPICGKRESVTRDGGRIVGEIYKWHIYSGKIN